MALQRTGAGRSGGRTNLMEGHVRHVKEPSGRDRGSEPGQVWRASGMVAGRSEREKKRVHLAARRMQARHCSKEVPRGVVACPRVCPIMHA